MRIDEFQVDRYGNFRMPRTECSGGLEVFYGPNESGKTLMLEAILRMLEPDIPSVMAELDRVTDPPAGYLVLESDGETYQLGDDRVLADVAPITPNHLRNVFVVRDNDLRIREHHEYYDSVTEQIGDLHTSEIEAIQDRLEDLGRLTSRRRNVSSAAEYDHAGDVYDEAAVLASDVREYVQTAREDGLDQLEAELVTVRSQLRRTRSELEKLDWAELASDYEYLSGQLDTVERLEADHASVSQFTRETLERLSGLQADIQNREDQIGSREEQTHELETDNERLEDEIGELQAELRPLEERESTVEEVEETLASYRDDRSETTGAEQRMRFTRAGALLGIGLGGIATVLGLIQGEAQLIIPLLLLLVGVGSGLAWYRDHRRLRAVEDDRTKLLEMTRDSGLTVDEISDVGPAISEFRTELESKRERLEDLERKLDVNEGLIEDHEESIESHREELESLRDEMADLLDEAGVSSIDAYREKVQEREAIENDLGPARQSLIEAFGESPEDQEAPIFWRSELEAMVDGINLEEVDPTEYDSARHEELDDQVEELEDRAATLREELEAHRHKLDEFADRASSLRTSPFVEEELRLQARSIEGLRQLAEDLESLTEQIKLDAEVSRRALEIFDDLHREEEAKITDLFVPGGRASEVFGRITDERYQRVEYDPDDRTLKVHRDTGERHAAAELSQGTRDQLYLAARISLAEQLLDSEPGFFLMDDAFLPADADRLRAGFEVLQQLVDDGWQVIYFTAKDEVGIDLVDEFGLDCTQLDRLP